MKRIDHALLHSVLIVEDSLALRETLSPALTSLLDCEVTTVGSVAECLQALMVSSPQLVLLDVDLGDGDAFDVLSAFAKLDTAPRVIAMSGVAGPDDGFRLAQLGVSLYLKKPIDLAELEAAVSRALVDSPNLAPYVRAAVGRVPLLEFEEQVRITMLREAIARSGGNRRSAARMLQVSRQLLQHMLRKVPAG